MKTKKLRIFFISFTSLFLLLATCYFLKTGLSSLKISKGLQDDIKYINDINIEVYQFPNRVSAQNLAENTEIKNTTTFIDVIPTENVFVEAYLCNSNPDIQYIANGTYKGNTKYRVSIVNGDINTVNSFSTYQLSEFFTDKNLVELVDGRMIDFEQQNTDCIEILVTENSPLNIDDEVYFTVNGLDKEFKQVVVKAKVVGIVKKGTFLYGSPEYCGHVKSAESLYTDIFERTTIFTSDISYLYEYEQSPNSLLDENIPVFLLSVDNDNTDSLNKLVNKNNGKKITLNVTTADYIQDGAPNVTTSIITIVCCLIIMLAIVVTNIILLIKFFKKDEKGVINKH